MLAVFLRRLLLGDSGLATAGAVVDLPAGPQLVFGRLASLLTDGDGFRQTFDWRGATSLRPCFRHGNVVKKDSDLAWRRDGFCEITCSDPSQFQASSSDDVWFSADLLVAAAGRVAAGTMPRVRFDELQKGCGMNANAKGLLAATDLRPHVKPVEVLTYDWMHNNLQEGVLTVEVQLLLAACEPLGLTRAQIRGDLCDVDWHFPSQVKAKATQLHRVFDPYRDATDATRVKCSASELLGLYQLLRWIVAVRVPRVDDIRPQLASFDAACMIIDVIQQLKSGTVAVDDGARLLQRTLSQHMQLHIAAYGSGGIRPKHHWNFDIPGQVVRDGAVLDCFIIERTHLAVKAVADLCKNTSRFERSVLAGLLNATLSSATSSGWLHSLLGSPVLLSDGVYHSSAMRVFGLHLQVGDLVIHGGVCGDIQSRILVDGVLFVVVETLEQHGEHARHWGHWRRTGLLALWVASNVVQPVAWKVLAGDLVLVLL